MKAEYQIKGESRKLVPPAVPGSTSAPEDPFAEDLFAVHKSSEGEGTGVTAPISRTQVGLSTAWHSRLPRVTMDEVKASMAMALLPSEFHEKVRDSVASLLSRFTLRTAEDISVALIESQEEQIFSAVAPHGAPRACASFVCEPLGTPFYIEIDASFAIRLIDLMLGGNGEPPNSLRPLTSAELAVVEFLFLSLATEVNQQIGAPLMRVDSIGEQQSWRAGRLGSAHADTSDLRQPGLVVAWRIDVGDIAGMAHAHLPAPALAQINKAQEELSAPKTNQGSRHFDAKLRRYAGIVPDVPLSILVGKTDLTAEEFSQLESGDVMVVERPDLGWRAGRFTDSLRVRVADGEEALILGDVSDLTDSKIKLNVRLIAFGESRAFGERLNMQEVIEPDEVVPEDANEIAGMMLTVRVELAARRLRLDELARLRANQVLDLGCQATDLVDLVVDGRPVARGELVDIEGRLGVRIKQVSTQTA